MITAITTLFGCGSTGDNLDTRQFIVRRKTDGEFVVTAVGLARPDGAKIGFANVFEGDFLDMVDFFREEKR